jgi:hypothetical protein
MRNFYFTAKILLLSLAFFSVQANAQAPQRMSYQSVLRNSSNALLVNTAVGIKISVLQGSTAGNAVYTETQTATTNANGLLSLQIGAGTADLTSITIPDSVTSIGNDAFTTGTFAGINWATGPYFIKTETDPAGGTNYSITGTQEILSVPYAMYATKSGDATAMGAVGGSSSTNGATINAGVLSLSPADAANGGIVTNGTQTIGGAKTFTQSVTANSFVKTGGASSQYLMADGSTSMGVINEGSFPMYFSGQLVTIKYKEITEGSSKIVHLYIPKFRIYGTRYSSLSSDLSNLLPENIRPYNGQALPCNIAVSNALNQDNNGGFTILHDIFNYVGLFEIQPSGAISFILPSGGPWNYIDGTAFDQTITYVVN